MTDDLLRVNREALRVVGTGCARARPRRSTRTSSSSR